MKILPSSHRAELTRISTSQSGLACFANRVLRRGEHALLCNTHNRKYIKNQHVVCDQNVQGTGSILLLYSPRSLGKVSESYSEVAHEGNMIESLML